MAQNVNSTAPNLLTVASNNATVYNCHHRRVSVIYYYAEVVNITEE